MDADLDGQAQTRSRGVDDVIASALVDHGHLDVARRLAAEGNWHCASAVAKTLITDGRRDEALDVLAPFTETDWWAAHDVSLLLQGWGRMEEAVAVIHPHVDTGQQVVVEHLARLLHQMDRADEAFALLRDRVDDYFLAEALVDVSAGGGFDDEIVALLAPHVEVLQRPGALAYPVSNAVSLLAVVRERQGFADEAMSLLRANIERGSTSVNAIEALAGLLARHGRESELLDFIAGHGGDKALFCWAEHLEKCGDLDGAIALLKSYAAKETHAFGVSPSVVSHLAHLLEQHGRTEEAIEVLRPIPRRIGYACGCLIVQLCFMLVGSGRLDEALEVIAEVAFDDGEELSLLDLRIEMLDVGGRREQAIEELRSRPDDSWQKTRLAGLLADMGRLDEAVAVLAPIIEDDKYALTRLAVLKIQQGHVDEAFALLRDTPRPPSPWASAFQALTQ